MLQLSNKTKAYVVLILWLHICGNVGFGVYAWNRASRIPLRSNPRSSELVNAVREFGRVGVPSLVTANVAGPLAVLFLMRSRSQDRRE